MPLIPDFLSDGLLPLGDYEVSLAQLRQSPLVLGPGTSAYPNWDVIWREKLVNNLEIMTRQLWAIGVANIFVNGSFVEDKDHPNDIDGYFDCDINSLKSGDLAPIPFI